jgi:hypothetical protein
MVGTQYPIIKIIALLNMEHLTYLKVAWTLEVENHVSMEDQKPPLLLFRLIETNS